MITKEKQLLLKDLCGRLSYDDIYGEVHMHIVGESKPFILKEKPITFDDIKDFTEEDGVIFNIKPYLRPMSSMTEEEKEIYKRFCDEDIRQLTYVQEVHPSLKYKTSCYRSIDWLNEHHFDYRGLIEKGLALEAPVGMYTHFGDMNVIVDGVEYKGKL